MTTENTDTPLKADCPSAHCSPSSLIPATDQIFQSIYRAISPDTDRIHSQALMEAAKNEVERMELQLQKALRKLESLSKRLEQGERDTHIINHIDEIFRMMGPRYYAHPTMDGRYPCWFVWLPKSGKCERKTLKEALIEFASQIPPENS